jgi:hypothetical protein
MRWLSIYTCKTDTGDRELRTYKGDQDAISHMKLHGNCKHLTYKGDQDAISYMKLNGNKHLFGNKKIMIRYIKGIGSSVSIFKENIEGELWN